MLTALTKKQLGIDCKEATFLKLKIIKHMHKKIRNIKY
jgi:hypothetical protein